MEEVGAFCVKLTKINEGELPQFYVENSHPGIVEPEVFALVQSEIRKRKTTAGRQQSGIGCFSSKVICGECGGFYGSKVWHSTSKYRRTVWQCNNKYKNDTRCATTHLSEETLQKVFVEAFNLIYEDKAQLAEDFASIIEMLADTLVLDRDETELHSECMVVMELIRKCVEENAQTTLDQSEYQRRYTGLVTRYEGAKKRLDAVKAEKLARAAKRESIARFFADLDRQDGLLTEFDEGLWYSTAETMTVHSERDVEVEFKDGSKVHVSAIGK